MSVSTKAGSTSVASLIEQICRCVYGDAFSRDLNPAQWSALRYFCEANRFSRTVTGFARFHGTTLGTASQTVKSLVSKRYLFRVPDKHDRRKSRLDLTAKARRALQSDPIGAIEQAAGKLQSSERTRLGDALRSMLISLHEDDVTGSFGACTECRHLCCEEGCGRTHHAYVCEFAKEELSETELKLTCINFEAMR